ncbi:TraR/DksA family transcriptional regulator [Dokdonella sp.]|uniref:TraR/DksA family transcriptional regulator n=1 Tax=Dokdonella sp. TaxID=2291710 RepID=UPI003528E29E
MSRLDLARIRERLLALQGELKQLEILSEDSDLPVELDQSRFGRLTRMDAMQARELAREARRRRQIQRTRLAGALLRLEKGEFGYCHICANELDPRRLGMDPTLTRCVDCSDI